MLSVTFSYLQRCFSIHHCSARSTASCLSALLRSGCYETYRCTGLLRGTFPGAPFLSMTYCRTVCMSIFIVRGCGSLCNPLSRRLLLSEMSRACTSPLSSLSLCEKPPLSPILSFSLLSRIMILYYIVVSYIIYQILVSLNVSSTRF